MVVKKVKIPKALREQVWLKYNGRKYDAKCFIKWCKNNITVYDYECSHNIPEIKSGPTTLENLRPCCSRCNKSMGSQYTIDEFNELGKKDKMCPIGCIIC
jgi:5-methylcytosine-specific restriction endonuclease McrA